MKTFMTTTAIIVALTIPAFAQTQTSGEGSSKHKASTAKSSSGYNAMGSAVRRAPLRETTGAASKVDDLSKESAGSMQNIGEKTGISGGGDGGGSGNE
jgi:hypothetical protein